MIDDARTPEHLDRSRGIFTAAELAVLASSTVSIAGVGGVGGRVAEVLARSGVGRLRLADPDTFSVSNLNRQAASTLATVGRNKSEVVAELCRAVSPSVEVRTWPAGITAENLDGFIEGADAVVDGTDYTVPSLGLRLARTATSAGLPVALGVEVAFGAWHTVLTRPTHFEDLMGLPRGIDFDALDSGEVSIPLWRWVQRIPPYLSAQTLRAVEQGEIEAPAIAPAVEISAAMLATDVVQLLLGRKPAIEAPRVHGVDVRSGRSWRGRPSKARFMMTALRASLRR
ncbi:ThiF family adenylyltransferase [Leucobacter tenebrionis]|uniref:ThiF family adenylyltransferase n=1 Tax=Leucobacter tenebrionis TaxID=2873270 RepID=UPI001CA7557C|nr:ThiF family adenylyltransferase [Leucobacter tenebrionis]QZY52415.1 ThiF family adenylyltransferase [Leucobacter tenebrionis]